jgi:Tol biopolymer transport system component
MSFKKRPIVWFLYALLVGAVCLSFTFVLRVLNPVRNLDQIGSGILFVSGRAESATLYFQELEGKAVRLANTGEANPGPVSWSPDGQRVVFHSLIGLDLVEETDERYGQLGLVFLDATGSLTIFGVCRRSPAWSPSGEWIAYHHTCNSESSLRVSRADGSDEQVLVQDLYWPQSPRIGVIRVSWSVEGDVVSFDRVTPEGEWSVWAVSLSEKNPELLIPNARQSVWSPTTNEIAFVRDGDIWLHNYANQEETRLAIDSVHVDWPTWSSDGKQIAFVSLQEDDAEIYVVNSDGTQLRRLIHSSSWDRFPAWRP